MGMEAGDHGAVGRFRRAGIAERNTLRLTFLYAPYRSLLRDWDARNKPSTVRGNRTTLRVHVLPAIGKIKIADSLQDDRSPRDHELAEVRSATQVLQRSRRFVEAEYSVDHGMERMLRHERAHGGEMVG